MSCEVAILAGGLGTRLQGRAGPLPKPMVPLAGRPLLEHQIELCARHGFHGILLLVHHGHEVIEAHFGDGARHGVAIEYAVERAPRGTGGALYDALDRLAATTLVLYGDTYLDVDLRQLLDAHLSRTADATLFVHPNGHPHDSDVVEVDAGGLVSALHAPPHPRDRDLRNLASAALFVVERAALEAVRVPDTTVDLVRDVFPAMLRAGRRLFAYVSPEYIKDIGTPDRLDRAARDIAAGVPERLSGRQRRSAVFLDRDGTLNAEIDHLKHPDGVTLLPGAADAVRRLNETGHLAVVVTNQPVVARGELTLEGLAAVQARLEQLLGRNGAYLDATYVCPHHPERGFAGEVPALKIACDCRKPATGSIDAACRDLAIDRNTSWLVGDSTTDIETGRRAGLRTVLVRTGYAGQDGKYPFRPDYVAVDLAAAVAWILDGHAALSRRLAPAALACLGARLVLVGGLARSGKSSAAQVLKELMTGFGRTAHVLPLDSWLKPAAERAEGGGVASRFDLEAALAVIRPLVAASNRTTLLLPVYDRARRVLLPNQLYCSVAPDDLLIVEGVAALVSRELAGLADVRVHLDMPEPQRTGLLRADYRWRGETGAVEALLASRAADETPAVREAGRRADFLVAAWTAS